MTELCTDYNRFADPDAAYRMLVEAHRGLSDAAGIALTTRLVLILANQVGDAGVLWDAIELAKRSGAVSDGNGARPDEPV